MKIVYADEFKREFRKLPLFVQRLYKIQEERFRSNWRDPRLHLKQLRGINSPFSFRVTRNWRVLFIFVKEDTVLFATIGNRKDVYR